MRLHVRTVSIIMTIYVIGGQTVLGKLAMSCLVSEVESKRVGRAASREGTDKSP